MGFSVERRAHIARKLHHLEGMTAEAIADHFRRENIADITARTVSGYFDDESADETIEKVRESHADDDIRIAESLQRKHDRARRDEIMAVEEQEIEALRPKTTVHEGRLKTQVHDWEVINVDDHRSPAWATENDVVIEFQPGRSLTVYPGEEYYVADPSGNPTYEKVTVGLERNVPDLSERRSSRYEQAAHLDGVAKRLGIDENELDVTLGGSIDIDHSVPDDVVAAVIGVSHERLDSNADGEQDDS